ncbi:IscS subfamily cysteine desulfurase [Ectobacillus antri]|jgi:cysteine desulfurase|uniref:IscS subfamily cysteine desulfurase n=1 Tax=Ectobacillus antri TaxID=2486280 RepID=A0ABT6H3F4_9BACI|nr:IscS subfamily cysteine desulfurase [Ectobacillus antri]MDG4655382.1 IscS subfamily cysteine desulfurase [Ectobacillus antri]MDG5753140.1 IscS subfamily cysteine desulfurase [Ectobacillus antri]
MIYLDYAATTPMSDAALQTFLHASKQYFGNEQSLHDIGSNASVLLNVCRQTLANLFGGKEQGVYFTSGGSEANYLALHSLIIAHQHKGKHIITTPIEHASIRNYFHELTKKGFTVTYVPVDKHGIVLIQELQKAIRPDTILASIQHGNSEIGTIQDIRAIGHLLREHDILFHTDCVQTFGKIPIHVQDMCIDSLSISAHKLYGPKGVGACYINPRVRWQPIFTGTSHEGGFRPGTVNVPGIAAFLTAAQDVIEAQTKETTRLYTLRDFFLQGLTNITHPIHIEGHPSASLPHIAAARIQGIEGQYTMLACNRHGIAISVGSACQIGKQEPSKTLLAVGRTAEEAKQYIRFSFGKHTTKEELKTTLHILQTMIDEYKGVVSQ